MAPLLKRSPKSHGGVLGRSTITNALEHAKSDYYLKADISNFFPSIRYERVQKHLIQVGHSEQIARCITKLCTHKYVLSQGLITSPILADAVLCDVDCRIVAVCKKENLIYSRFIDDITISGTFNFHGSGIPKSVKSILEDHGFGANQSKWVMGKRTEGAVITGLSIKKVS